MLFATPWFDPQRPGCASLPDSEHRRTSKLKRNFVVALLAVQFLFICVITGKWLSVSTHRLYVEDRTDNGSPGASWQHFVVEKGQVVPQIITRNDSRITFSLNLQQDSTLHFWAAPTGPASYEIYLLRNGNRQLLLKNELPGSAYGSAILPAGPESLEIDNHGAITWSDLRVVTTPGIRPYLGALVILFLLTCYVKQRTALPGVLVRVSLALASAVITLVLAELGLHLLREKLPFSVVDSRRDYGMFRLDPRWQFSARYQKRLRPNSNSVTQWSYGDLVQMAVIPAEASRPILNRYRVWTDREGFRNQSTRDHIAVATLGDSFTDSLMLPVEQAWPAQLERILGVPVQNYGTAGFGPQQELYVLEDYAIQHQPKVVVVAYFAGNDLFDAESFAKFQQSKGEVSEIPGWKIKKLVYRIQTFYTYTLASMALRGLWRKDTKSAGTSILPEVSAAGSIPAKAVGSPTLSNASFDRGMFHVPVHGHNMSFALMPPYLRTLNYSKAWLESRPGWDLTRQTYQEMKRTADQHGATMVVMFIPFKSQVYLPLLQGAFPVEDLNHDFRFYFRENQTDADVNTMAKNRLAQNQMMRDFCEETGILFLDLTPTLQHQVEQGINPYLPDDAHWSAVGQELAARELAGFLGQHHLDNPRQ